MLVTYGKLYAKHDGKVLKNMPSLDQWIDNQGLENLLQCLKLLQTEVK